IPTVVEQNAFAVRRISRDDLVEKVDARTEFVLDVLGEKLPVTIVTRVDRALRMWPVRILAQRVEYLVAELPVQLEKVPRSINREVCQQVSGAVFNGQLKLLEWRNPWWRALEHGQFSDTVCDRRHDLHR